MAKRRNFSTGFKAKVALAAIRGDVTMGELASRCDIHQNMIAKWKRQALAGMKEGFGCSAPNRDGCREAEIKTLQAKVGELINVSRLIVVDTKRTQKRELISLTTSSASTILDEDGN